MSGKEEEKGEFIPVESKKDRRTRLRTANEKSPTPTPPIPDTIGSNGKKKKPSSRNPRKGEQTTSGTTATKTSEDVAPEKIHSDEQIGQTEHNEAEGDQNEESVMSPAPPAVFSPASPASTSKGEMLPIFNPTRKTSAGLAHVKASFC